ncbi:MAG: hypothetical protein AB7I18_06135 [Candidatus Berkiella sp.]
MKVYRIAVMLNGSEYINYYEKLSNLWRMKEGLKANTNQAVLYYNLESSFVTYNSLFASFFSYFTGQAYEKLFETLYKDLVNKIITALYFNRIEKNGVVEISLFGFGQGATLARHFAVEYIEHRLKSSMLADQGINIKLDAEYLFDSVRLHSTSFVSRYFKAKPISYTSRIPMGTKAYHALSLDDFDIIDEPLLIDQKVGGIEELWFSGDQLDVGGGHMLPAHDSPPGSSDALGYMVMRARENGLEFTDQFIQKLSEEKNSEVLSVIHNRNWFLPPAQRRVRAVYVQKDYSISDEMPLIHETAIRRMQVAKDPDYQPAALLPFTQLQVLTKDGRRVSARFVDKAVAPPLLTRFESEREANSDRLPKANPAKSETMVDVNSAKLKCR